MLRWWLRLLKNERESRERHACMNIYSGPECRVAINDVLWEMYQQTECAKRHSDWMTVRIDHRIRQIGMYRFVHNSGGRRRQVLGRRQDQRIGAIMTEIPTEVRSTRDRHEEWAVFKLGDVNEGVILKVPIGAHTWSTWQPMESDYVFTLMMTERVCLEPGTLKCPGTVDFGWHQWDHIKGLLLVLHENRLKY